MNNDRQQIKLQFGPAEEAQARKHLSAVARKSESDPTRPRFVCVILHEIWADAQSRGDKATCHRVLEAVFHAELIHRAALAGGFEYPEDPADALEMLHDGRERARLRREKRS